MLLSPSCKISYFSLPVVHYDIHVFFFDSGGEGVFDG